MPARVTGGSQTDRDMALRAYSHVMEVLPSTSEIPIQIVWLPLGWPEGTEARSTPNGIQISMWAIVKGPEGRPEYLLYEEIAHHVASQEGLPHGGNTGVFLQEMFAGYVKFLLARQHHPQLISGPLTLPDIGASGWQRFYGFGTDLGAPLAGMDLVEPVIERFLANPAVSGSIRVRGVELLHELRSREWIRLNCSSAVLSSTPS